MSNFTFREALGPPCPPSDVHGVNWNRFCNKNRTSYCSTQLCFHKNPEIFQRFNWNLLSLKMMMKSTCYSVLHAINYIAKNQEAIFFEGALVIKLYHDLPKIMRNFLQLLLSVSKQDVITNRSYTHLSEHSAIRHSHQIDFVGTFLSFRRNSTYTVVVIVTCV